MMKLLYIIGRGHSGTTALDITMGQALEMRSTGEFVSGLSRAASEKCTCGASLLECQEWGPAIQENFTDKNEFLSFASSLTRLASIKFLFGVPLLLRLSRTRKLLEKEAQFLESLGKGEGGVIDSSKELTRGTFLAFGPARAAWLHVVRNPVDVVMSARGRVDRGVPIKIHRKTFFVNKKFLFPLDLLLALIWTLWTVFTVAIGRTLLRRRYICVTYEYFVQDPGSVANRVASMLELPVEPVEVRARAEGAIKVGHILGGNRMARQGEFEVKALPRRRAPFLTKLMLLFISIPVYWFAKNYVALDGKY